jgi:hypothetical protein
VNSNSSSTLANPLALTLALKTGVSVGETSSVVSSRGFAVRSVPLMRRSRLEVMNEVAAKARAQIRPET